jgi:hypothetical protein
VFVYIYQVMYVYESVNMPSQKWEEDLQLYFK